MQGQLLLALTAGMLGAVNPCGFALLPAYLSVLVAAEQTGPAGPRAIARAVGRAARCTAALTTGYVIVFGLFGLLLAPLAGWLQPRLPWLTVLLGLVLVVAGGALVAGRQLPRIGWGMRAPRLTGSAPSMVLFGMAYATASLGCAVGPFLAIVVSSLQAGTLPRGVALFGAYAAGMGLVVGATALAVALVRVSLVARLRRAAAIVPRLGGVVLVATGGYVAYYGGYELRLVRDLRVSGHDPVINAAGELQHRAAALIAALGAGPFVTLLAALLLLGAVAGWRSRRRRAVGNAAAPVTLPGRSPAR